MKAVAPGKLILSGEHAVVYGKPAIAMAIDRSAVFELTPQSGGKISFDLPGDRDSESFTLLALRDLKRRMENKYREFQQGAPELTMSIEQLNEIRLALSALGSRHPGQRPPRTGSLPLGPR